MSIIVPHERTGRLVGAAPLTPVLNRSGIVHPARAAKI